MNVIQLVDGPLHGRLVEFTGEPPPEYRVPHKQRREGPWGGWLYVSTAALSDEGLPLYRFVETAV